MKNIIASICTLPLMQPNCELLKRLFRCVSYYHC